MADSRYIPRTLDIAGLSRRKSLFLFGPRQTGKTALVRHALPSAKVYDLLDGDVFRTLSHRPVRLGEELESGDRLLVVDEIQKLPELLDEVHRLIEQRSIHFVLTGSSARKLRRGGVNLLGGRAPARTLHPFIYRELGDEFVLERALDRGLLPSIYFSTDPKADLGAYVGAYLREEVAAEALTRNVPAFSRFLEVAALCHGTMLNFSQIASDAQTPVSTVREYFHILEDTLVARLVPAWTRTRTRKAIGTAKYYFFDCGVVRRLAYWRSTSNFEVDFVLAGTTAIEVKSKDPVGERDLRGIRALKEEALLKNYIVVSLEQRPRTVEGIRILPWKEFLERLWDGALV